MFSWLGNESQPVTANIDHLKQYQQIVLSNDVFNDGDIICLREVSFLSQRYAGCSTDGRDDNYYACVLKCLQESNSNNDYLGSRRDIRIATVDECMRISVKTADSRLFYKPEHMGRTHAGLIILKDFINDKSVEKTFEGLLVRPRAHTNINSGNSKFTSLSGDNYKLPLMVLKHKPTAFKIHLVGEESDGKISEVEVEIDLLCEYTQ